MSAPNRTRELRRRNLAIRWVAGTTAVAAFAMTASLLLAQPQPAGEGKAKIVQRRGPEIDVRASAGGQVVVLFPNSNGQNGGKGQVEVTLVESTLPTPPAPGQAPTGPQGPTPTGREFVFNSADARDQTVSYKLDVNGQPRKLMLLAKVDGQLVEARPGGGSEGVQVFTVPMPETPKPPEQPPAEGQPPAAPPVPSQAAVVVVYTGGMQP